MRDERIVPLPQLLRSGCVPRWLILVFLVLALGPAADATPQKTSANSEARTQLVLSRARYLDRAKAIWIGQMIGQWTGLQFEHKVASALPNTPFRPLPGYAPIDDDYYYEMVAVRAFEKYGIDLTVEQLGKQWLEKQRRLVGLE